MLNFIRKLYSFQASTQFEKVRLEITCNSDTEAPEDYQILRMMNILGGKDLETRPQVAFMTIVNKIQKSDSIKKWNYMLKNLIILDRSVEEQYFLQDIAELKCPSVENFKDEDNQNSLFSFKFLDLMLLDQLVFKYFFYIKEKARNYQNKNSIFNVEKKGLSTYLKNLQMSALTIEVQNVKYLIELIFDLISTEKRGLLKFKLNQYIFFLLLHNVLQFYTILYVAIIIILERLLTLKLDEALQCRQIYTEYIKITDNLVAFITNHKFIEGFQISTSDFKKSDPKIVKAFNDLITILEKEKQQCIPEINHVECSVQLETEDENKLQTINDLYTNENSDNINFEFINKLRSQLTFNSAEYKQNLANEESARLNQVDKTLDEPSQYFKKESKIDILASTKVAEQKQDFVYNFKAKPKIQVINDFYIKQSKKYTFDKQNILKLEQFQQTKYDKFQNTYSSAFAIHSTEQ